MKPVLSSLVSSAVYDVESCGDELAGLFKYGTPADVSAVIDACEQVALNHDLLGNEACSELLARCAEFIASRFANAPDSWCFGISVRLRNASEVIGSTK